MQFEGEFCKFVVLGSSVCTEKIARHESCVSKRICEIILAGTAVVMLHPYQFCCVSAPVCAAMEKLSSHSGVSVCTHAIVALLQLLPTPKMQFSCC